METAPQYGLPLQTPCTPHPLFIAQSKAMGRTEKFEGCQLMLYKDQSGQLHIGRGRNIESIGITEGEADVLYQTDFRRVLEEFRATFREFDPSSEYYRWNQAPNPQEQHAVYSRTPALLDLLFNLGLTRFLTFKKMIAATKELDWEKAATELMDSEYAKQLPMRAKRNHRMLLTGEDDQ